MTIEHISHLIASWILIPQLSPMQWLLFWPDEQHDQNLPPLNQTSGRGEVQLDINEPRMFKGYLEASLDFGFAGRAKEIQSIRIACLYQFDGHGFPGQLFAKELVL